jgi:hypothetical protein
MHAQLNQQTRKQTRTVVAPPVRHSQDGGGGEQKLQPADGTAYIALWEYHAWQAQTCLSERIVS